MPRPEKHIFVCMRSRQPGHPKGSCQDRQAQEVLTAFAEGIETRELFGRLALTKTGCLGYCDLGALVLVYPDGVLYQQVTAADVSEIIDQHLLGGEPIERLKAAKEIW